MEAEEAAAALKAAAWQGSGCLRLGLDDRDAQWDDEDADSELTVADSESGLRVARTLGLGLRRRVPRPRAAAMARAADSERRWRR
eukprot:649093-Rhodomonas_salina.1